MSVAIVRLESPAQAGLKNQWREEEEEEEKILFMQLRVSAWLDDTNQTSHPLI